MHYDSDIAPGTKHDGPAVRKIPQSCRALGLTFVDVPETLHKEMHHLEALSAQGEQRLSLMAIL
jgi:hypothetical protein